MGSETILLFSEGVQITDAVIDYNPLTGELNITNLTSHTDYVLKLVFDDENVGYYVFRTEAD
jgi:hypothetical protein